ncbi:GNAT family N-acetyltransferase [Actinopolymorpha sp. NPDC004070]|uniref:GNAT family N-acetyltransferase n=1 Tax=Actinopolymorpha sp. NPDC004070 TaxID=3154548 RepID=UPI0033A3AE6F
MAEFTERLRLEPVGPAYADDLWLVHADDKVWPWYGDEKPSREQVVQWAGSMGESWRSHGAGKWIAYDRTSREVVGRGGLGRTPVDDDWGRVYEFLPDESWVRVAHDNQHPSAVHANWAELGWALRHDYWGCGYAAEIGRAGLAYAFDVLGMEAVVSCTDLPNVRSRAVMERLGMRYAGELWSEEFEGALGKPPLTVCVLLRSDWERSTACYRHSQRRASGSRTPPWFGLWPPSPSTRRKS